jgi:hypothetical protein
MNLTQNIIFFLKRKKILVLTQESYGKSNIQSVLAFNSELMNLGYTVTNTLYKGLLSVPVGYVHQLYDELISHIREALGADQAYRPMYINFPQQVMNMSDVELYVNAMFHYWSLGKWEPPQQLQERGFKWEDVNFKNIDMGTQEEFESIFTSIVGSNGAITEMDKQIVNWFFDNYDFKILENLYPDKIPFKENLCLLASIAKQHGMTIPVKNATDVLRIAVHMSGGDISLPMVPKPPKIEKFKGWQATTALTRIQEQRNTFRFKKFNRSERRWLLEMLENCSGNVVEDMWAKRGRWLRLCEILHPGEYRRQFPEAYTRIQILREKKSIASYNSDLEKAFQNSDLIKILRLLEVRPGVFARRLDHILRKFPLTYKPITTAFSKCAIDIATPLLLKLREHFSLRNNVWNQRVVIIKGKTAKKHVIEKPLPGLSMHIIDAVRNAIDEVLVRKFETLDKMADVYIHPHLDLTPIPSAMRSVNSSLRTLVRGTRIPFPINKKVIRAYVHWNDEIGTQDIDLSCTATSVDFTKTQFTSFRDLRDVHAGIYHSGDVRQRMGPCAEYIDVDIQQCLEAGYRYVFFTAHNFQNGSFTDLKECVFGWMFRQHPQANEIFLPKTITEAFALTNSSPAVYTCVVDLLEKNVMWLDLESEGILLNPESTNLKSIQTVYKTLKNRMTIGDLLRLHVKARKGNLVNDITENTQVFDENFAFEYDKILSEFM